MNISERASALPKPTFLFARTAPPSMALQTAITLQGMHWVHCALVQTQAEPLNGEILVLLNAARAAGWHVFVSPQAARAAFSLQPEIMTWPGRFAAVGLATAAALNLTKLDGPFCQSKTNLYSPFCQGKTRVLVPARGEGAQALLDMPDLQQMSGSLVAIYAAPDGLPLLDYTLTARGARILRIPVYRRVATNLTTEQIAQCSSAQFAYVGSVAFLEALLRARGGKPMFVLAPSARVASAARALGCPSLICESTNDEAIAAKILLSNFSHLDLFQ